jgi:general secretion pathway protein B
MSYILDALKRADAERERGQVPGLHAQSIEGAPGSGRATGLPRWALAAGGGTALVVVAALAWRMGADAHAPLPAPLGTPESAPAPMVATAPPPMAEPPAAAPAPVIEPAPAPAVAPAPPPVAYVAPPAPRPAREVKPAAPRPAPPPSPVAMPTLRVPAPVPAPAAPRAPDAAPTAIPLLADLPGTLRQQLPNLTVTGSVYSDDASSRFVMLNGEVVKEGGQPAPGLVLERIEPKSAVLRFKGQRFRLAY